MLPHDGVGGWTPRPRYERADSVSTAWATPRLAETIVTGSAWGRAWRRRMRGLEAPSARAAATNSRALALRISPRTTLAVVIQLDRPIVTIRLGSDEPRLVSTTRTRK